MHVQSGHNFVVDILFMFVSSMGLKYFIVLVQTKASLLMVLEKMMTYQSYRCHCINAYEQ